MYMYCNHKWFAIYRRLPILSSSNQGLHLAVLPTRNESLVTPVAPLQVTLEYSLTREQLVRCAQSTERAALVIQREGHAVIATMAL